MQRLAVVMLALPSSVTAVAAQSRAADEAAIRAQAVAIQGAVNKRDAVGLAALSTSDGDEINGDGPRVVGRAAMRQSQEAVFATWSPTMRFTVALTAIRFLRPDVAIVEADGHWSEGAVRMNRATWVMVREDGKWLLAAVRVYPAERPR